MTVNSNTSRALTEGPARARPVAARGFIFLAQLLVLIALVVGLNMQAGLHPLVATAVAGVLLLTLVASNRLLTKRALAPAALAPRVAEWPANLNDALNDVASASATSGQAKAPARMNDAEALAAAVSASPLPELSQGAAFPPPMPRYVEAVAAPAPLKPAAPVYAQQPAPQLAAELPVYAPVTPAPDYWAHRPAQPRFDHHAPHNDMALQHLPAPAAAAASPVPALKETAGSHRDSPAALRETDVEAIQSLIKKLADEVNLAEQARDDSLAAIAQAVAQTPAPAAGVAEAPPALAVAPTSVPELAIPDMSHGLSQSLDALRVTAETMRQPSHLVFGHELPPPIPVAPSKGALLAEAIAADRADVLLEPILGLRSQDAQHFEVSLRLRAPDGAALDWTASDETLRGTGLLPLFDAAKIARTSSVARSLGARGKTGAVFSTYSGEALTDAAFLAAGATVAGPQRSTLVLTFSQSDARGFEAPEWAAIGEMRALGFRFALSEVTDLDMDLEGLVAAGFEFVKLEADVFMTGLRSPAGLIPATDVCRFLAGMGLGLIVERIDDEERFARVTTCGALFGQGQLFGGPRVLKAEASGAQAAA